MEIHQLRYFVAAAECGSFSRAAERCHVAQPSLSAQVRKLETSLGHSLFDRQTAGAVLTDAGHALLARARRILAEVADAQDSLGRDLDAGDGPLAVGAIPTMAPFLLPPALGSFFRDLPRCRLTVREDLTERLLEALVANELDCALLSTPIDHPLIAIEVLGTERLLLAAAADYPLPPPAALTLAVLRDQPTIVVHEMHCLGQQVSALCASRGIAQRIVCRSSQLATVAELVGMGLGLSLIPEMAARADADGRRRYLALQGTDPRREIAVAFRRDRSRSRAALQFVAQVRADLDAGRHRLPG
jgi:LysR family hydrogen peroxide-inducible transcriptional activator